MERILIWVFDEEYVGDGFLYDSYGPLGHRPLGVVENVTGSGGGSIDCILNQTMIDDWMSTSLSLQFIIAYQFKQNGLDEDNDGELDGPTFRNDSIFYHEFIDWTEGSDTHGDTVVWSNYIHSIPNIYMDQDNWTSGNPNPNINGHAVIMGVNTTSVDAWLHNFTITVRCSFSLAVHPEPTFYGEIFETPWYINIINPEEEQAGALGDLNGDGTVNVIDIVMLISCILGQSCFELYPGGQADLNSDGTFNIYDIISIVELANNYSQND